MSRRPRGSLKGLTHRRRRRRQGGPGRGTASLLKRTLERERAEHGVVSPSARGGGRLKGHRAGGSARQLGGVCKGLGCCIPGPHGSHLTQPVTRDMALPSTRGPRGRGGSWTTGRPTCACSQPPATRRPPRHTAGARRTAHAPNCDGSREARSGHTPDNDRTGSKLTAATRPRETALSPRSWSALP